MRAFVELRRVASSFAVLQERLEELEREMAGRLHQHDEQLEQIFKALHQMIAPPQRFKRPVGFRVRDDDEEPKAINAGRKLDHLGRSKSGPRR